MQKKDDDEDIEASRDLNQTKWTFSAKIYDSYYMTHISWLILHDLYFIESNPFRTLWKSFSWKDLSSKWEVRKTHFKLERIVWIGDRIRLERFGCSWKDRRLSERSEVVGKFFIVGKTHRIEKDLKLDKYRFEWKKDVNKMQSSLKQIVQLEELFRT